MKKFVLSVLSMMLVASIASAQDYKPFKLGLGLGYAKPGSGGGGILVDLEPAYRINDDIAVGLRIESAVMAKISPDGTEASASANGSYTVNGQYYLTSSKVRPYVGAGVGVYMLAAVSASDTNAEVGGGSEIGFYPRLGLDIGNFNINIDYNIISSSESVMADGSGTTTGKIKNSYMGIRIGGYMFGGRR
ncbi:opacity protein-like surface antigen [Catalinimonas alkaloidigena]|uniref:outer membrane beta-barrel protein n=1 Tax=Catalinimonas alkaloidigena TaxID=1075417 RepID=UPI002405A1C0|nr:OmpW family outer membrane protein [Catalinimonas alkaloidigena]MDF9795021.1 opacity protein-like surface antigen [Catalinimonas alkaloidigena]